MHTRNKAVLIRLTEKEKEHLKKQAEITGLKVEPFLRSLIMNMIKTSTARYMQSYLESFRLLVIT